MDKSNLKSFHYGFIDTSNGSTLSQQLFLPNAEIYFYRSTPSSLYEVIQRIYVEKHTVAHDFTEYFRICKDLST